MLERGKISGIQTFYILVFLVSATALEFLPAISFQVAGRDAWMAPALSTLAGIYVALVITSLGKRFPGQTLIQYLPNILGNWLGRLVGLFYLVYFFYTNCLVVREFVELPNLILPETPTILLKAIMVWLCAWAVREGLEVLARTIEITFPITFLAFVGSIILAVITGKGFTHSLLPLLENGVEPVIRATFTTNAWRGEIILLAMLLPYLARPEEGKRWAIWAVIFLGVILTANAIISALLFGPTVSRMTFPTFSLLRIVNIGGVVERLESIAVVFWIISLYAKIAIFYYVTVLGTAQLLNLRDYRPLVFPFGVILVALAHYLFGGNIAFVKHITTSWPPFAYIFEYLLPTLLLFFALSRGRRTSGRSERSGESPAFRRPSGGRGKL
jgi:spore germination protein KB